MLLTLRSFIQLAGIGPLFAVVRQREKQTALPHSLPETLAQLARENAGTVRIEPRRRHCPPDLEQERSPQYGEHVGLPQPRAEFQRVQSGPRTDILACSESDHFIGVILVRP